MEIIRRPRVVYDSSLSLMQRSRTVGLVPTMGALHAGHMSLVRTSMAENDVTVVSIFVNPSQFGPGEDLDEYPRDLDGDISRLQEAGVDTLFMPSAETMYPEGFSTTVQVGEISERLCGPFRPGHFTGVATVVAKLLNMVAPTRAYFGLKDYQQSLMIRHMARDLNLQVEIAALPTMREPDGLAMSTRNQYLQPEARKAATVLYRALQQGESEISTGNTDGAEVARTMAAKLEDEPLVTEVQYAGVYDPETLADVTEIRGEVLLAGALKIGDVRLIDNVLARPER